MLVTPSQGAAVSDLTVIVVSWNVSELLDRCLCSLHEALERDGLQARVWVVDNGSSDGSVDMVRSRHPWVHVEALPENVGYVRANNLALAHLQGQGRAHWLLNPDTIVYPGTAVTLLHFLDTHARAGLVAPNLLNLDGSRQECAFRFPGLFQLLFALGLLPPRFYHTRLNGRYASDLFDRGTPFPVDHPLGAAMMVRDQTLVEVGPLDEGYFMYCEEIDWAWRMASAGWERWLLPHVAVTHVGGASSQQARPQTTAFLWESRARLYRAHRGRVTYLLARAAVLLTFRSRMRHAPSPTWADAYRRILEAWR